MFDGKDMKYNKIIQWYKYIIEVLPFWIVPGRSITWEMGGGPSSVHYDPMHGICTKPGN